MLVYKKQMNRNCIRCKKEKLPFFYWLVDSLNICPKCKTEYKERREKKLCSLLGLKRFGLLLLLTNVECLDKV